MKFGDKLIELRKKNGYSQEELAEKLGVSRQSVSKWESNNTYPETDKIIQIANLFECSMDDLINDKITDIDSSLRKNKNNIYTVWDSLLDFITKTVNMFSKMTFKDGLECLIKMFILGLLLSILGNIICGTASSILANIFSFINNNITYTIKDILNSIFHLLWFIISVITIIYTFKIKYLNNYEQEKVDKNIKKNNNKETTISEEKINNQNEKPFEFLSTLSKIVVIFIKFLIIWVIIGMVFTTIGLVLTSVITLSQIFTHIVFLLISLILISSTVISIQIIIILISFIFDKKVNIKLNIIIFISCILIVGISSGLTIISIKNIELVEDNSVFNLKTKELKIDYKDNLVIENDGIGNNNKYKYIIDNNIEENKIIINKEIDEKYFKIYTYNASIDQLPVIKVHQETNGNIKNQIELIKDNLKKNKLVTYNNYGNDPLVIKANEKTINNLIENLKKLHLIEENKNNQEIEIITHTDKVYFKNGLKGQYNAIDDTIKYEEENYSCIKELEKTEYGDRIIYTCDYK